MFFYWRCIVRCLSVLLHLFSYIDRNEAADINHDGKPDIVVSEENGGSALDAQTYWFIKCQSHMGSINQRRGLQGNGSLENLLPISISNCS